MKLVAKKMVHKGNSIHLNHVNDVVNLKIPSTVNSLKMHLNAFKCNVLDKISVLSFEQASHILFIWFTQELDYKVN